MIFHLYRFGIASILALVLFSGCALERTNPCDPARCEVPCQTGYSCNQGICVKASENFCFAPTNIDTGTTDMPLTDSGIPDGQTSDSQFLDSSATDLPTTDLPTTDLPATDLPTTDLPTTDSLAADSTTPDLHLDTNHDGIVDDLAPDAFNDALVVDAAPIPPVITGTATKAPTIVCGQTTADDCIGTLHIVLHTCSVPENCPGGALVNAIVYDADLNAGPVDFSFINVAEGQTFYASAVLVEAGGQIAHVSGDLLHAGSVPVTTKVGVTVDMTIDLNYRIP
jgi:hypothetical protein